MPITPNMKLWLVGRYTGEEPLHWKPLHVCTTEEVARAAVVTMRDFVVEADIDLVFAYYPLWDEGGPCLSN